MFARKVLQGHGVAGLSPWAEDWGRALTRRGHSPHTIYGYLRHALLFEKFLKARGVLSAPGKEAGRKGTHRKTLAGWTYHLDDYNFRLLLDHLGDMQSPGSGGRRVGPATVSSRFTSVTNYLKHLARYHDFPEIDTERFWDDELRTVTKQVKKLRARRTNTPPTVEELRAALAREPLLRNKAVLLLAAKTGARRAELLSLDWVDVDLERGVVHFKDDGQHFKRTTYEGLVDAEAVMALKLWKFMWQDIRETDETALFVSADGLRMGRGNAYTIVKTAFARVGLPDKNVHSLRHWFSDTLRAQGMPDHMIAYLRGDAPATTLDLYTHLQSEAGRAALRRAYDAAMPRLT